MKQNFLLKINQVKPRKKIRRNKGQIKKLISQTLELRDLVVFQKRLKRIESYLIVTLLKG